MLRSVVDHYSNNKKLGYIDLYSGPGKYKDGTPSTPIKITETVINDEDLSERMVLIFNDHDGNNISRLRDNINSLPKAALLKYDIAYNSFSMASEISEVFKDFNLIPSLIFLDPFGIKGLSKALFANIRPNFQKK